VAAADAAPAAPPRDAVTEARLQTAMNETLGAAYVPGANSPEKGGFSPGGLVQWVYRQVGVTAVPQLVEDQMVMAGVAIESGAYAPQVGDLLFFEIGGVNHVGLYFDARKNTFLTVVPGKGGVVVADFDDPFFRSRFLFARRIGVRPGDGGPARE
jgi:cell wall-associated NlpC family hydrolase